MPSYVKAQKPFGYTDDARVQEVVASSRAAEDYDIRLPPVDMEKCAAREHKAINVRSAADGLISCCIDLLAASSKLYSTSNCRCIAAET